MFPSKSVCSCVPAFTDNLIIKAEFASGEQWRIRAASYGTISLLTMINSWKVSRFKERNKNKSATDYHIFRRI